MDSRFANYNLHQLDPSNYWDLDNHLRALKSQPFVYHHPVINELPKDIPGIYTIGGGRQIGKTTLLKQWIAELIENNTPPEAIGFFTGELIDDHHALVKILQEFISEASNHKFQYIIIDEITYVQNWDKAIKFAADAGYFERAIVVLTGSDLTMMQSAKMTFPGRRGIADKVDFHIYSLSFKEFMTLKNSIPDLQNIIDDENNLTHEITHILYKEFSEYLLHGGYLTAINDIAKYETILPATLKVYTDWIVGDMLKRGKQESYVREILFAIIKSYSDQVTWQSLSQAMSIDSHNTVADYCQLLATMDALFIQSALQVDKLTAAPKKARKITFTDPFIYHAVKYWLSPVENPFEQITHDIQDSDIAADLVEATVSNYFRRFYPTYYIKSTSGEIDVAYIKEKMYWPIEVKWRNQLRPDDIKLIAKYPRGTVYAKTQSTRKINDLTVIPLPYALLKDV